VTFPVSLLEWHPQWVPRVPDAISQVTRQCQICQRRDRAHEPRRSIRGYRFVRAGTPRLSAAPCRPDPPPVMPGRQAKVPGSAMGDAPG
jgi:hypothetical protein